MAAAEATSEEGQPRVGWSPVLRFGIAAVLLAYLVWSVDIRWSAFGAFLGSPVLLVAAAVAMSMTMVLTSARLPVLLRAAGFELSLGSAMQLTVIGMFFGLFLPGSASGDAAKIWYTVAEQRRGTRAELATIVLLERAIGLWAMFAMPLLAAPFFDEAISGHAVFRTLLHFCALVFVAGGLALGAVLHAPAAWVAAGERAVPWKLVWRSIAAVREYRRSIGTLASALGISILAHASAIATTAVIAAAVAPDSVRPALALVVPLGFVANAIPLTPGGLGVGEIAFHRLFEAIGLSGGAEVAIGWRVAVMAMALAGGWLYVRGFRSRLRNRDDASAQEEAS